VRVALVYDCLFPFTVGGAERWYRNLAERLAAAGHDVTYLTLRQWERGDEPDLDGVNVVTVGPRMTLYSEGRRRVVPPLVFGLGVLAHLLRRGRRYDVVHTASFPYFSLLAAASVRRLGGFRLIVDWIEFWTREYWLEYLGPVGGRLGWWVQRLCARTRHRAFALSELHARRLREHGYDGTVTVLGGLYAGPKEPVQPETAKPVVVFAGRHVPEKRVTALVPAIALARERVPNLRAELYGDGPERASLLEAIDRQGLDGTVQAPGFVEAERIDEAIRRALCLVLPSRREGYGLVVVEAAAQGTPSVVVADPDNAATELVDDGENGFVAASSTPEDLAAAIVRVYEEGQGLRESTSAWFQRNAGRLSLESSLDTVLRAYAE
jgi:glycosyltransferase involved in cell wall biosynthesis